MEPLRSWHRWSQMSVVKKNYIMVSYTGKSMFSKSLKFVGLLSEHRSRHGARHTHLEDYQMGLQVRVIP